MLVTTAATGASLFATTGSFVTTAGLLGTAGAADLDGASLFSATAGGTAVISASRSATAGDDFVSSASGVFTSVTTGFALVSARAPFSFEAVEGLGATDLEAPLGEEGLLSVARTEAGAGVCEARASAGFTGFSEGFAGECELVATRGSGACDGGPGRTLVTTFGGDGEYDGRMLPDAATCGGRGL